MNSQGPFGGGQTNTGAVAPPQPQAPAGQFGGNNGQYGVITLANYFAARASLAAGPLHIEFQPGTFVAVARLELDKQFGAINPSTSITSINQLEEVFGYVFEIVDTPALELQSEFTLAAVPEATTNGPANVADVWVQYQAAGTYALALAFLTTWFGSKAGGLWSAMTTTEATARLAAIGLNPPA
jgi:hypothetical protein